MTFNVLLRVIGLLSIAAGTALIFVNSDPFTASLACLLICAGLVNIYLSGKEGNEQ